MIPATAEREVQIFPDGIALTRRATEEFLKSVRGAIAQKGAFTVALAGGSTPKAL
jgi:6-phosphogluconolactonase